MKVQHLIKLLEQLPWDAPVVGAMSDEVDETDDGRQFVPEGCGYDADIFWDSENKQATIVLG